MAGEQRLVGGDDRAADLERGRDGGQRRAVLAADQLDEEIDVGRLGERDRIVEPGDVREVDAAIAVARLRPQTAVTTTWRPSFFGELDAVLLEDADQRRADIAEAGDADPQRRQSRCPRRAPAIALRMRARVSARGSRPSRRSKTNSGSPAMVRPKRVGVQPRAAIKASTD